MARIKTRCASLSAAPTKKDVYLQNMSEEALDRAFICEEAKAKKNYHDPFFRPIQIFTDIDDTIWAAGHSNMRAHIAGVDERLPKKTIYPCVRSFYKYVHDYHGKLYIVAVSARPFNVSNKQKSLSKKLGVPFVMYGGDVTSAGAVWGGYRGIGEKKISNIEGHLRKQLFSPVYGWKPFSNIWIGDNGQGDEIVAKRLLEGNKIMAAFIHIVNFKKEFEVMPNLHYFCTYQDVAGILGRYYDLHFNLECPLEDTSDYNVVSYEYAHDCQKKFPGGVVGTTAVDKGQTWNISPA